MSQAAGPSRMHPDDPNFEEWCLNQLEEDDNLISDEDESFILESEHNTESEQSENEDFEQEDEQVQQDLREGNIFFGREKINPFKW